MMHEQLNGMDEKLEDTDLVAVILASFLKSYRLLISVLSVQQRAAPTTITPQVMIDMILNKFDRLQKEGQAKDGETVLAAKGKG